MKKVDFADVSVEINSGWEKPLSKELEEPYFKELTDFVNKEYKNEIVYPSRKNIFRAFDLCSFDNTKVVILGQDPYHGKGQANGLCFAVSKDVTVPPSLRNIFKEIESDFGNPLVHKDGDLSHWAEQGVLLLNATLTVRANVAGSHQGYGWEHFTDAVVRALSKEREHIVFLLWGNYARQKGEHIDRMKHLVLETTHPSPFSVYNGFFGCKHFSKANEYLKRHKKDEVRWL